MEISHIKFRAVSSVKKILFQIKDYNAFATALNINMTDITDTTPKVFGSINKRDEFIHLMRYIEDKNNYHFRHILDALNKIGEESIEKQLLTYLTYSGVYLTHDVPKKDKHNDLSLFFWTLSKGDEHIYNVPFWLKQHKIPIKTIDDLQFAIDSFKERAYSIKYDPDDEDDDF